MYVGRGALWVHARRRGWVGDGGRGECICVCDSGMRQSVWVRPAICTCHSPWMASERNPSDVIVSVVRPRMCTICSSLEPAAVQVHGACRHWAAAWGGRSYGLQVSVGSKHR